jgi:hypothetical protein
MKRGAYGLSVTAPLDRADPISGEPGGPDGNGDHLARLAHPVDVRDSIRVNGRFVVYGRGDGRLVHRQDLADEADPVRQDRRPPRKDSDVT